ncbi:hypothetical protein ACWGST_05275 [Agromyces sp. NPDC055520]
MIATGCGGKSKLNVREDKANVGQTTSCFVSEDDLIVVDAVVVSDPEHFDPWFGLLEEIEVRLPRVGAELVVERSSGRVDMRIPPTPHGTPRICCRGQMSFS